MRFTFHTLGCKLNFAESSALGKVLLSHGHIRAGKGEDADVCVVNTCSVTDVADSKGRQLIRRLHREHPDASLVVTGCYAQLRPEEVGMIEGVDYVVGANDKERIAEIVSKIEKERNITDKQKKDAKKYVTDLAAPAGRMSKEGSAFHPCYSSDDRTRCFLKVQDGCDYYCTYCTIPMARGRSRNASVRDTAAMAREAIENGAKEIILTGVNIGDFGRTTGETFIELLQALDNLIEETPYRIRISSCEPNLLMDEIIDFVATSRHFAPHFHIPLQSGSDEVLRIMHRRYDTALFAERVHHIKERLPNAFIGVDCMVGVRGETEEHFADYVRFIESLPVTQLHVFPYSEREGTRMVEMQLLRVSPKEQKQRVEKLIAISNRKLKEFYRSQQGMTGTALWEAKHEKTADGQTLMSGWTENYVRVSAPYNKQKVNTFETLIINNPL